MASTGYWADNYLEKRQSITQAVKRIRPGQRVFIASACGEPQALVRALSERARTLSGIEVVRLLSLETTPVDHDCRQNP
jgi:acyl-CoA hydrolase